MLEAVLLFTVFFGPLAFGCVEAWSLGILQASLFSLPIVARSVGKVGEAAKPLLVAVGVLLVLGVVQLLNPSAIDGPAKFIPFTASASRTQKALLLWASYGALLWAAPRAFLNPRTAHRFPWAIVVIGFTIATIGLIQSAQGNKFVMGFREVGYGHSPFGPYYNNAHAASLLAVSALMGLGLLTSGSARVYARARREQPLADAVSVLALLAFLIGVIIFGLISTHNRGSLLAVGGASLIAALMSCGLIKESRKKWGLRAVILLVFIGAGAAAYQLGFSRRGSPLSIPYRISMYQSALQVLSDFPMWGTGLGTVISVFAPYKDPSVIGVVDHIHNDWLELPLQAGLPAAGLVFATFIAFGRRVYESWLRETSMERRLLIGGAISSALCFSFHATVDFTWQIPANAVIFLLILSWLWSQTNPLISTQRRG